MILTIEQYRTAVYILLPTFWLLCMIIFLQASKVIELKRKLKELEAPKAKVVAWPEILK